MTQIVHAVTQATGEDAGADLLRQLTEKLAGVRPALVVCFASMAQPLGPTLAALHRGLGGVPTLGSSTAGEFTEQGEHPNLVPIPVPLGWGGWVRGEALPPRPDRERGAGGGEVPSTATEQPPTRGDGLGNKAP